jgi:hypothetical protein
VVSWYTVWESLYPNLEGFHNDHDAKKMHRLRGLIISRATEVESALKELVRHLEPNEAVPPRCGEPLTS